jgi:hypothetical protein
LSISVLDYSASVFPVLRADPKLDPKLTDFKPLNAQDAKLQDLCQ